MTTTLYLTAEEKKMFKNLPDSVQKSVAVEDESLTFKDSDEKRAVRMRNVSIQHPAYKMLQKQTKSKKPTEKMINDMVASADLSGLSEHDVMELAFAWGPDVFTVMIAVALTNAKTQEEIVNAAGFSRLRHGLFLALNR